MKTTTRAAAVGALLTALLLGCGPSSSDGEAAGGGAVDVASDVANVDTDAASDAGASDVVSPDANTNDSNPSDSNPSDTNPADTASGTPCPNPIPSTCEVTFTVKATSPLKQDYVWLSGDFLSPTWAPKPAAGAVELKFDPSDDAWSATVQLPHGRVVAYKYLAGWADNPGPVWFNQEGQFDDAPNSVRVVDCKALTCGVASGRAALTAAVLKAHGEEIRGAQNLVGLGLGVVVDGEVAALSGFGYADKANQVLVEADKTRFRWASISKSIVGVVAAKLASKGLLKLDDDALAAVDDFPPPKNWVKKCDGGSMSWAGQTVQCKDGWFWLPLGVDQQKVTFWQLLGNLGGIPHYSNGVKDPSPPQGKADDPKINTGAQWALSYLAGQPLVAVPGAAYKYTTFGFNLAGVAIGASQKTTLEALVKQWVSGPFQLKTLRPDRLWEDIPHRAVGYWKGDDGTVLLQGSSDVSWKLGGGGFISTVADMASYCRALSDLDRFDEPARKLAWTSQKTSAGKETGYGLGFSIGGKNGKKRVGHSGSQQKVRSNLRLYPDEKLCFVMATNSTWASVSKVTNRLESLVRAALEVAEGP